MNRFRKKSDVKRSQLPDFISSSPAPSINHAPTQSQDSLPELPSTGDFRTSLILPDLSRRFSLLRSSTGEPVTFDNLRYKFAEQRARGSQNHITEEEEDMILDALGRIRTRTSTATSAATESVGGNTNGEDADEPKSIKSGSSSFVTSSPNGRSAKRYSNNLFSSGRRDYSYIRHGSTSKGSTRTTSLTPTESSIVTRDNTSSIVDSLRPATPDNGSSLCSPSVSLQPSPNDKSSVRSAPLVPPAPYGGDSSISPASLSAVEYRLAKTFGQSSLQRASMALEEVMKEIEEEEEEVEEEVEEEIVMPRTVPIPRGLSDQPRVTPEAKESDASTSTSSSTVSSTALTSTPSMFEAAIAISHDKQPQTILEDRRASPIPTRILPGYIPGMPRPMTPRDLDVDEQRSHSTTPRATSPVHSSFGFESNSVHKSRRGSVSSARQSPRPTTPVASSPLFLQRSTNGRYTPEDSGHYRSESLDYDTSLNSSIVGWRRPASPLSASTYQPLAAAASTSRPSTPSNVIWNPNRGNGNKPSRQGGHSRNGSWVSDGGMSETQSSPERSRVRSPALSDSPVIDRAQAQPNVNANANAATAPQPAAPLTSLDLGSPAISPSRATRSPTPTQNVTRSPTQATFDKPSGNTSGTASRRSSRQTAPSSPFNLFNFSMPILSPIANSSRSSLDSTGSSFHSYDDNKDPLATLFGEGDVQQPAWYDVSYSEKSSSAALGGDSATDDGYDAEDIIMRYGGLKKADFIAIQEKLVKVAVAKDAIPDTRERAPSSMRKRRPSTSQSNYSSGGRPERIASPPPGTQPVSPVSPTFPTSAQSSTPDQYSKLLLLNSVVDSIQSKREPPMSIKTDVPIAISDPSPNTRRNRDLAHVLFGNESDDERDGKTPKPEQQQKVQQVRDKHQEDEQRGEKQQQDQQKRQLPLEQQPQQQQQQQPQQQAVPKASAQTTPPSSEPVKRPETQESKPLQQASPPLQRNQSTQKTLPRTNDSELERRVQQQAEAAMAALGKRPSNGNLRSEGLAHSGSIRKRISPNQISEPRLVSATTSVDTIPLRSPSLTSGNGSKLGSRFKIFRGARAKHSSTSEESAVDPRTPPANQTIHYDPAKLKVPGAPSLASASETGRYKVPVPSPPASAGPGLRGFMARFRNKRGTEVTAESEYRASPQSRRSDSPVVLTSLPQTPSEATSQIREVVNSTSSPNPPAPRPDNTQHGSSSVSVTPASALPSAETHPSNTNESALRQLFDAAGSLGLDQSALTDLLARSGSTSRASNWRSKSTSTAAAPRPEAPEFTLGGPSSSIQESADDHQSGSSPSVIYPNRSTNDTPSELQDGPLSRKPSARGPTDNIRRPRENVSENAANSVVRRTIIYASDAGVDLNALMRKHSSRRRRASGISVLSGRSVQDRVPTPPPPKSPTSKRFSSDAQSPPVPQLPQSLGPMDNYLNVPSSSSVEKSNSAYDSLYEMYAGESRVVSSAAPDSNASGNIASPDGGIPSSAEPGPALEVIELANGETIWSIVNGLRDDDEESLYTGRTSFASEYSTREPNVEGLQIFVKEHTRSGSKGSNTSFLSRKKPSQGKSRPETKVYHTTTAHIARLMDNLSQGMDAGSINIVPGPIRATGAPGHSASSSLSVNNPNWTMEERIDHMLSSIRKS